MTADELNDALRDCKHARTRLRLREHIAAMESEHRALLAANAVLRDERCVELISAELESLRKRVAELEDKVTAVNIQTANDRDRADKAERERDELFEENGQLRTGLSIAEAERDEARVQVVTARASALEEAAQVLDVAPYSSDEEGSILATQAVRIRALATTPPPQTCTTCRARPLAALDIADGITTCVPCANRADGDET